MTTPTSAAPPLPYHRMAFRAGHHRWWRPVLELLLILGGWAVTLLVINLVAQEGGAAAGRPEKDGVVDIGELPMTVLGLAIVASLLPLVLLAVRWAGRRPAGMLSSVTGRLRRRWLGRCLVAMVPVVVVLGLVLTFVPFGAGAGPGAGAGTDAGAGQWVGWSSFAVSMAVVVVCVPFQAAAEEYAFRGWMMQAVGGFLRSPWAAVVPQAVLFGAAHGWGTTWGFVQLCVFGLVAGYLTVRTGGLEAAIALHVMNNLLGYGFAAAVVGGLSSEETAADSPALLAVVDMAVVCLYAVLVLWLARRHRPQHLAGPLPATPAPGSPHGPVPTHPRHAVRPSHPSPLTPPAGSRRTAGRPRT